VGHGCTHTNDHKYIDGTAGWVYQIGYLMLILLLVLGILHSTILRKWLHCAPATVIYWACSVGPLFIAAVPLIIPEADRNSDEISHTNRAARGAAYFIPAALCTVSIIVASRVVGDMYHTMFLTAHLSGALLVFFVVYAHAGSWWITWPCLILLAGILGFLLGKPPGKLPTSGSRAEQVGLINGVIPNSWRSREATALAFLLDLVAIMVTYITGLYWACEGVPG
jgi:hypothetical protein